MGVLSELFWNYFSSALAHVNTGEFSSVVLSKSVRASFGDLKYASRSFVAVVTGSREALSAPTRCLKTTPVERPAQLFLPLSRLMSSCTTFARRVMPAMSAGEGTEAFD